MMCPMLITVFYWISFPTLVRGLDCYECDTMDSIDGCLSPSNRPENLLPCPNDNYSCFKLSWDPNYEPFRGCIDLTNEPTVTLGCSAEWEMCELNVTGYVSWRCWGLKSELTDSLASHNLSSEYTSIGKTKSWNERLEKVFNATDVTFCYCNEHGCNNSMKYDLQPVFYILLLFSFLSKVMDSSEII